MQSDANSVGQYLKEVPEARKEALTRLREMCREILVGYEESMAYGMPSYGKPDGEVEVAFASQKNYISLYILKQDALDRFRDALKGVSLGKGCIRYTKPERIDFDIVRQLLAATRDSEGVVC
jgi:uncharacterized protein YdhG (YjbR/CyaY superfamily)